MDNNSHIKIHFYGQYWTENRSGQQAYDTIHRLTYPEVPSTEIAPSDSNVWMVLRDPRSDFGGRFPDAPMGYKLFRNDRGTYYSLITRNPHDFRAGYINITLLVDNGYHVHGSAVVKLLSLLYERVLKADNYEQQAVEQCVVESGIHAVQTRLRPINPDSQQPMAYRTYNTDAELVDLMHFIDQAEYSRFNGVIFVSSKYVNPNIPMHRITSQLVKVYGIHSPVYKVEADRTLGLRDGSRATIIYTKPGYANKRVSFTVGAPCECVSYDGSTIVVKEPPATLQFAKNVVVVVMKDGKPCDSARVVMQVGSQAPLNMHSERTKGKYVFNDFDAPVDSTIEFKVRELNCEVASFMVPFSEIVSDKPLRQINLESRKKTVTLLFADGQSQTITIPEGGEIDMALKRGSYMGKAVEVVSANTYKVHKRRATADKPLPWWRKKWVMIVGAVIALAAIASILYLLVFKKADAASNRDEITVQGVAMNDAVIDYMAKNDVWQRDSIKADSICEQVYICMGKGNFTKLDSLAYDKLPDSLKNEKYSIISTKFKQLQPTDSAEVINKMSKLFVDENGNMAKAIDLGKILEFFAPFITDEIPDDYKEDKPVEKSKDNDKTKTVEKDKKKTDKETNQQPQKQETITKPEPPAQDPAKLAALQSAIASYNKVYADYEKANGSAKEVMKSDIKAKEAKVVQASVAALGNNVKWAELQSKYGCKPQVK